MKRFLQAALILTLSTTMLVSCKKEITTPINHLYPAPTLTVANPIEAYPGEEITLTGTHLDIATRVRFTNGNIETTTFTATETSIKVTIPENANHGNQQVAVRSPGGEVYIDFKVLERIFPPTITSFTPLTGPSGMTVTIQGTWFRDVQSVKLNEEEVDFTVIDDNGLTFMVPADATSGKISIITSTGTITSIQDFTVNNVADPIIILDEGINANWQMWGGWGTALQDAENTEHPKTGTKAYKITFNDDWGGTQLHPMDPNPFSLLLYNRIKVSIYGGAGVAAGTKVALYIKNNAGVESDVKELVLTPGQYTDYIIPLSDLNNPADIAELILKNYGTNNITIYVDDYILE